MTQEKRGVTMLSNRALLEVSQLTRRARELANGNSRQRKESDVILAQIKAINTTGVSSTEAREIVTNEMMKEFGMPEVNYEEVRKQKKHEELFRRFIAGGALHEMEAEIRDFEAGTQTITYTKGPEGGFLVPQSVSDEFQLGLAATTPLLDKNIVTIRSTADPVTEPGTQSFFRPTGTVSPNSDAGAGTLRPIVIPAIDTTYSGGLTAFRLGENVQAGQNQAAPMHGTTLNWFAYRTQDIPISFELEQDSFVDVMDLLQTALPIALARGAGGDLAYGTGGGTEPTGIVQAAVSSGVEISLSADGPGAISTSNIVASLEQVMLDVDVVHRSHPKCAWLMDDGTWMAIRKLGPSSARPLAFDRGDVEYASSPTCGGYLLGKPVYICNDLAGSNGSNPVANIIFGNLSRFYVRQAGSIRIRRNLESAYVTNGQALYTALMRLDSNIVAAGDQPIVSAVLTD
jgi:HK97 family phage major capsid protein